MSVRRGRGRGGLAYSLEREARALVTLPSTARRISSTTPTVRDPNGRRGYSSKADLVAALNVRDIQTIERLRPDPPDSRQT